jgi:hypothetical protein
MWCLGEIPEGICEVQKVQKSKILLQELPETSVAGWSSVSFLERAIVSIVLCADTYIKVLVLR